jgi:hypothetical protein
MLARATTTIVTIKPRPKTQRLRLIRRGGFSVEVTRVMARTGFFFANLKLRERNSAFIKDKMKINLS